MTVSRGLSSPASVCIGWVGHTDDDTGSDDTRHMSDGQLNWQHIDNKLETRISQDTELNSPRFLGSAESFVNIYSPD